MPAIITLHPTFAFFHQPYEAGTFVNDVGRFARMINGTLAKLPTINPRPTLQTLKWLVGLGKPLSVDIETAPTGKRDPVTDDFLEPWTGKDPTRCRLRTIGFGNTDYGLSFTWKEIESRPKLHEYIKRYLASRSHTKVLQNGQWFDLRVLKRYDFIVNNWRDTRDFRRALSNTSRLGLRYLGSIATDVHNWKDDGKKESKDGKGVIFTRNMIDLKTYNAWDTCITARVDEMCQRDLVEDKEYEPVVRRLYSVHRDLSVLAAEMHTTGIHVNQGWRRFMLHCIEEEIGEKTVHFLNLVYSLAAHLADDMRCTHNDMRALIYKRHSSERIPGFQLPDPLDKNMYTNEEQTTISVDADSLLLLLVSGEVPNELVPIIDAFWDVESLKKQRSFLALTNAKGEPSLLDKATGPDGRLRPGWNSCGTDTMRFSCAEPNVMNWEQILRHALDPGPGNVIVHADKAQLEVRMMENISGDVLLKKMIDTGDIYSGLTCEWFGRDPETFDKNNKQDGAARKTTKIMYLGRQYRAGLKAIFVQALREDRKFTFDRVRTLVGVFDSSLTGVVNYWEEELMKVQKLGYSQGEILMGRHYYPAMPDPSEVANKPIQRTAAEMMNVEILELKKRLKKYRETRSSRIIIQLHDAVDVEGPEKRERVIRDVMTDVMHSTWTIKGRKREYPVEIKSTFHSKGGTWADV